MATRGKHRIDRARDARCVRCTANGRRRWVQDALSWASGPLGVFCDRCRGEMRRAPVVVQATPAASTEIRGALAAAIATGRRLP